MNIEKSVIDYYSSPDLAARVIDMAGGAEGLSVEKLSPYDEMHVGGHPATQYFLAALNLQAGQRVLDIGCGIGGAARAAAGTGAHVTGIDLTPDYCLTATMLSELVGLGDTVAFEVGNATALKFADATFDAAYTIHAAMNIADKAGLYAEAFRVLKSGSLFGLYDIMMENAEAPLSFPLPWATAADTSFLASPGMVTALLTGAGFTIVSTESRRDFGVAALNKMAAKMNAVRTPLGGGDFGQRVMNLLAGMQDGACAPHQIICRKS
jgi:SAM-dependent methyltransferase